MVVNIDSIRLSKGRPVSGTKLPRLAPDVQRAGRLSDTVSIGIVNNMAGAAFKATERQFVSLLDAASAGVPIHLSFYTLPGLSILDAGGQEFVSHYASVESLLDTRLDGLIVTGREPKTADLRDEPYWESFTQVLEWARTHTHSAVWSCLAAHAAVLHMDGIGRRRSDEKNFGIFQCAQGSNHAMMRGVSPRYRVPHSRWNGVAHKDLKERGYTVLSRIANDGVDTFVKQEDSLFVFFQGHLEYETDTLMREYRRDVGRYIQGDVANYPLLPHGYFNSETEEALTVLRKKAAAVRTVGLLNKLSAIVEQAEIENTWRSSAVSIYRNWLDCILARKAESEGRRRPIAAVLNSR
jgi:homoserine O-succinyltransferase